MRFDHTARKATQWPSPLSTIAAWHNTYRLINCLTVIALLAAMPAAAQPSLTAYPQQFVGSNPAQGGGLGEAVSFAGRTFFTSDSREEGKELWVTDGTPAGTSLFADLCRGTCSSDPGAFSVVGGRLFFSAFERGIGRELWVLEAGAAAPRLFADIAPGSDGSNPERVNRVSFVLNGSVRRLDLVVASVFDSSFGVPQSRMWRIEGNSLSEELAEVATDTRLLPDRPAPVAFGPGRLLVTVKASRFGNAPSILQQWVYGSDGRVAQVIDGIPGFPADTSQATLRGHEFKLGNTIYVRRSAGSMTQLWAVQDTPGGSVTQLTTVSNLRNLTAVSSSGLAYFTAGANDELHRSNATPAGTQPLGLLGAQRLSAMGTQLLLFANVAGEAGNRELHRTAGLSAPTLVRELVAGSGGTQLRATTLSGDGTRLYLLHGDQLWVSDGTSAGTQFLNTLVDASNLLAGDVRSVLLASSNGEPHFSAGQLNDLRKLAEVRGDFSNSEAAPMAVIGQRLLYNAKVDSAPAGLMAADRAGLANRVRLQASPMRPGSAVRLNGGVIAQSGSGDAFFTEGLAPITERVALGFVSISPSCAVRFDGGLLISNPSSPFEPGSSLLRIDGRPSGTRTVIDSGLRFDNCFAGEATLPPGGSLLMAASSGSTFFGLETRLTRFTPPNSLQRVLPAQSDTTDSPAHFVRVGDLTFFAAGSDGRGDGRELWVSDGSEAGTRVVRDIEPGPASSDPRSLRVIGNRVVFFARTRALGREPWVSDGSEAGTLPLADLFPGPGSSSVGIAEEALDQNADLLLFSASVPENSLDAGCPLFQTDGTPAGTDCVQPARAFSNAPGEFAPARSARFARNGLIAFVAHERERGEEVFVVRDRVRVGSVEPDLRPGPRGSAPTALLADGNDVFFGADDGVRGSELFRISLGAVDRVFNNGFENPAAAR